MTALLIFALVLYLAVLASRVTERTAASVSVLFIAAGLAAGPEGLGWIGWTPTDPMVRHLATFALVAVLFTDGMRLSARELRAAWRLPGRALLFGLPLTLLVIAGFARWLTGLGWMQAFLIAAVLTPTDPVFVSAIVDSSEVPTPLRRLLNVESGVNDGIALPIVLLLIAALSDEPGDPWRRLIEVVLGAALGFALPWLASKLRSRQISKQRRPLYGLAIGLLAFAAAGALGANEYVAAFLAGVSFATNEPGLSDDFQPFGEQIGSVLKLLVLLVFGALLTPRLFGSLSLADYGFALATLVLARPIGLLPALWRSGLGWPERLTAAWFGPKGFASLIYAIYVLRGGVPEAQRIYHLAAIVIVLSIVSQSSTDVPIARWFARRGSDRGAPRHAEGEEESSP